jgi:hypothetical protein
MLYRIVCVERFRGNIRTACLSQFRVFGDILHLWLAFLGHFAGCAPNGSRELEAFPLEVAQFPRRDVVARR